MRERFAELKLKLANQRDWRESAIRREDFAQADRLTEMIEHNQALLTTLEADFKVFDKVEEQEIDLTDLLDNQDLEAA